jgi:hypothetical protein
MVLQSVAAMVIELAVQMVVKSVELLEIMTVEKKASKMVERKVL